MLTSIVWYLMTSNEVAKHVKVEDEGEHVHWIGRTVRVIGPDHKITAKMEMVAAEGQHGGGSYCRHQPIPYMKYCHEIRKCPLSLQLKAASGRPRLILGADERQNESGPHLANPTLGAGRHQTFADVASETSSVSALACSSYGRQRMPSQTRKVRRCALFSSTFRHMPHTVSGGRGRMHGTSRGPDRGTHHLYH